MRSITSRAVGSIPSKANGVSDCRLDKRETIDELVKYKLWSETKPRKRNTPPVPASR